VVEVVRETMRRLAIYLFVFSVVWGASCSSGSDSGGTGTTATDMQDIVVPESFTFEKAQDLSVFLVDAARDDFVRFQVYAYDEDTADLLDDIEFPDSAEEDDEEDVTVEVPTTELQLLAQGFPNENGVFETTIRNPSYVDKMLVVRQEAGVNTTAIVDVSGAEVSYTFPATADVPRASPVNAGDFLYAVNSNGGFYSIDLTTNVATALTGPGFGSIACAYDRNNDELYIANRQSPYQLVRYDPDTENFTTLGNFHGSFPRMEYNHEDGMLWIANGTTLWVVDPATMTYLATYSISGVESPTTGGDLVRAEDGTWYMTAFSGLYVLEFEGTTAAATRISAEDLPFNPTSLALDEDQEIAYMCTNEGNARFVAMSVQDGAFTVLTTFSHKVNDLTQFYAENAGFATTDSDGDGIVDDHDDYPNDADVAFDSYTPSVFGLGTLGFEDLWPNQGDYDFNDLVVNYRINRVSNSDNEVVRLDCVFTVKAAGASFVNGFGFEIETVERANVASVTGSQVTQNAVTLDSAGLETGQTNPVIIVFDSANDQLINSSGGIINTVEGETFFESDEISITITFNEPVPVDTLGTPPFNPFLFSVADRGKEIHLANHEPTDLADTDDLGTGDDDSDAASGRYYVNETGLPWAIDIIHDFTYPIENAAIISGYNHFETWAESGATQFTDWYKDNEGYRNTSNLYSE
ncbi:MAG: LruC domain-containing protein, partial [Planctomycetota bacterium]